MVLMLWYQSYSHDFQSLHWTTLAKSQSLYGIHHLHRGNEAFCILHAPAARGAGASAGLGDPKSSLHGMSCGHLMRLRLGCWVGGVRGGAACQVSPPVSQLHLPLAIDSY